MSKGKSSFFAQVYAVAATIPSGKVTTYGRIAAALGGVCSAKIVGFAMRSAPDSLALPCHRVVNRLGEPAPGNAFGGPDRQRLLLEQEGVPFLPDGRVDLPACLFQPDPLAETLDLEE